MRLTDLTCWQVKVRLDLLNKFQEQVEIYFEHVVFFGGDEPLENEKSLAARNQINKLLRSSIRYIHEAGINRDIKVINVQVPTTFDVVENIFNLDIVPSSKVTDLITQAIGVYELDYPHAKLRTCNPLFWLKRILRSIGSIPFAIVELAGWHVKKYEDSSFGKGVKLFSQLAAICGFIYAFLKAHDFFFSYFHK
jgi:hypothetical protein